MFDYKFVDGCDKCLRFKESLGIGYKYQVPGNTWVEGNRALHFYPGVKQGLQRDLVKHLRAHERKNK